MPPIPAFFISQQSSDRYEAAQAFSEWYGFWGAERHMRANSIARCFPWIPGKAQPADRAREMEEDLRRQSTQLKLEPPTEMQEWYDPWGHQDATSLFKEVSDSAETEYAYHSDMYVTSEMTDRWKEIYWLQIDKRCWKATYGPDSQKFAHLHEARGVLTEGRGPSGSERNPPATATTRPERRRERS